MNASGEALDRWVGYTDPDGWTRNFDAAIADPTTIDAKTARYATAPDEALAAAMGRIQGSLGKPRESVEAWQKAMDLAGAPRPDYAVAAFIQQNRGLAGGSFAVVDLKATGETVMAQSRDPRDALVVAATLSDVAADRKDPSIVEPFLARALKASESMTDPKWTKVRGELQVADALLFKKDPALAVQLKKAAMPPGWEGTASGINEFAWWCFEKKVNLEEAQTLARKGVELAEPGAEKAEALDTLAELCNELGNCKDALELSQRAAKEDPSSDHYTKQIQRFTELAAKKPAAGA